MGSVANDLVKRCIDVSNGKVQEESLLGSFSIPDIDETSRSRFVPKKDSSESPLRGSSFRREVGITNQHAYQCAIVRALVEKHKNRAGIEHAIKGSRDFKSTPAFLTKV